MMVLEEIKMVRYILSFTEKGKDQISTSLHLLLFASPFYFGGLQQDEGIVNI